jgi:hypothetical protein
MTLGPVELLVLEFPGNQFKGEIAPALKSLVERGTIRIIDLLFILRDQSGEIHSRELTELDADIMLDWDPLVDEVMGLLSSEDVEHFGQALAPNSSAAVLLFENTWATEFRDAVVRANGRLILSERIPRKVMDELVSATEPVPA